MQENYSVNQIYSESDSVTINSLANERNSAKRIKNSSSPTVSVNGEAVNGEAKVILLSDTNISIENQMPEMNNSQSLDLSDFNASGTQSTSNGLKKQINGSKSGSKAAALKR